MSDLPALSELQMGLRKQQRAWSGPRLWPWEMVAEMKPSGRQLAAEGSRPGATVLASKGGRHRADGRCAGWGNWGTAAHCEGPQQDLGGLHCQGLEEGRAGAVVGKAQAARGLVYRGAGISEA